MCPIRIHNRNRTRYKSIIIQLSIFNYLHPSELVHFDSLHHVGPNYSHTQLQAAHSLIPFARCKSCPIPCEETGAYQALHVDATDETMPSTQVAECTSDSRKYGVEINLDVEIDTKGYRHNHADYTWTFSNLCTQNYTNTPSPLDISN